MNSDNLSVDKEKLLKILSAAAFLIFFQAYMVAPLIPRFTEIFNTSPQRIGLIIPIYMIPYGIATLFYGLLSDHLGRKRILLTSMLLFIVLMGLTATAQSADQLIIWRLVSGIGVSGVVPLSLALMSPLYPFEQRGRPLGWIFAAMSGGMAFGSTFGAVLEPIIGWRLTFVGVSILGVFVLALLWPYRNLLGESNPNNAIKLSSLIKSYREILNNRRAKVVYSYVFLNGFFHSGVFTWLGLYLSKFYGLGEIAIGVVIVGWGIPGFLFGPSIGKLSDRHGRSLLIPVGLALAAFSTGILIFKPDVILVTIAVAVLSLGYDMTQPLFAGIVTALSSSRPGLSMGLNVFLLFTGFGAGSLVFGGLIKYNFDTALIVFVCFQIVLTFASIKLFKSE
jgi:predicted MFS family arabinose efflux permease